MNEFPEFINENEAQEMLPQIAAIVGQMFGDRGPDTRELEWRNLMLFTFNAASGESNIDGARLEIENALNDGFALNQKLKIKRGIIYWQGARLRKPEGE